MPIMKKMKSKLLLANMCLTVALTSATFFEQKKELEGKITETISTSTERSALQCLHHCRFIDKTSVAKYEASQCKCVKVDYSGSGTLNGLLVQKQTKTEVQKEEEKEPGPAACMWLNADSSAGSFEQFKFDNWELCQKTCLDRNNCQAWKWISEGAERFTCSFMMTFRKDRFKRHSLLGKRDCTACMWQNADSSAGAFEHFKFDNWELCQKTCLDRINCQAWRWISEGADRFSCSFMMIFRKDRFKRHSLLGKRDCTDYPKRMFGDDTK